MISSPANITSLKTGEIFVFGSNLSGVHGAGAARLAYEKFGAEWGKGFGFTGQCFAIPTKNRSIRTMELERIKHFVDRFRQHAITSPHLTFLVTRIGCGLAGYKDEDMAPLFKGMPDNVLLPAEWRAILLQ